MLLFPCAIQKQTIREVVMATTWIDNCGHEIEMTVNPRINATSKLSQGVEWSLIG